MAGNQRLAELRRRAAELYLEQARLATEEAELLELESAAPKRKPRRRPVVEPALAPVSELDRARARAALRSNEHRRRIG